MERVSEERKAIEAIKRQSDRRPAQLHYLAANRVDHDKLYLERNFCLGSAVSALLVFIQLLSVGVKDTALEISLIACTVSLPSWIALSVVFNLFLKAGPVSYPLRKKDGYQRLTEKFYFFGAFGLLFAVGAGMYHLEPLACYIFAGFTIAASVLFNRYYDRFVDTVWAMTSDSDCLEDYSESNPSPVDRASPPQEPHELGP